MKKIDLCEDCANEKDVMNPESFGIADMLLGLGASQELEAAGGGQMVCDTCGFTHADFKKSGRLGCPECYSIFEVPLESMVKQMHKGTEHQGKFPKALRQARAATVARENLQERLAKAIEEENYEMAAQLRDELKAMEKEPAGKTAD
jgi:protein arginine kinase activator|tara:strand:+ start:283 stop:723 length:441 start_codon:yes stop_codon:yes gene_type:complete